MGPQRFKCRDYFTEFLLSLVLRAKVTLKKFPKHNEHKKESINSLSTNIAVDVSECPSCINKIMNHMNNTSITIVNKTVDFEIYYLVSYHQDRKQYVVIKTEYYFNAYSIPNKTTGQLSVI